MTMVVIACGDDRAFVMTDTASYSKSVGHMAHTSKVMPLPHLDLAVVTQGDSGFGLQADTVAAHASYFASSFDELLPQLPGHFRDAWAHTFSEGGYAEESTVFIAGYSEVRGRFTAVAFSSFDDFEPFEIEGGLWISPMPWSMRPMSREVNSYRRSAGNLALFDEWEEQPEPSMPRSIEDFIKLALQIRYERALEPRGRVIVAGRAFLTEVGRDGSLSNIKLVDYEDGGSEFLDLISYTQHPLAQVAPCEGCDSGEPAVLCSCADNSAGPCGCRSGKPFGECCMVKPEQVDELLAQRAAYLDRESSST